MTDKMQGNQQVYPQEFAAALELLRESLGVTNWPDFGHKMQELTGIRIKVGTWQHMAPNYKRNNWPNSECLYILEASGVFRFRNGEAVTAGKLLAIYHGDRDRFGNPIIKSTNGAGSGR